MLSPYLRTDGGDVPVSPYLRTDGGDVPVTLNIAGGATSARTQAIFPDSSSGENFVFTEVL